MATFTVLADGGGQPLRTTGLLSRVRSIWAVVAPARQPHDAEAEPVLGRASVVCSTSPRLFEHRDQPERGGLVHPEFGGQLRDADLAVQRQELEDGHRPDRPTARVRLDH